MAAPHQPRRRHNRYNVPPMDPAISQVIAAKQAAFTSQLSTALLRKQLDVVEAQGEAVNQLLQSAARLSHEAGKGGQIDLIA